MQAAATEVFLRFFTTMKDPRRHNVVHDFSSILVIAIMAVLCNSNDWDEVVEWAKAQREWLASFLVLTRGIPSADTFRRVFARINPEAFEKCFIEWTHSLAEVCQGRVVAIDGKTLRRSFTQSWEKQGSIHLVSAWCGHNQMTLGQLATDSKSNEITAIPELMDLLDLKGAIVTIDAMGCQKEIAAKIRSQEAHYILAVKDNEADGPFPAHPPGDASFACTRRRSSSPYLSIDTPRRRSLIAGEICIGAGPLGSEIDS